MDEWIDTARLFTLELGSLVLTTDSRCERGGVCVRDCLVVSAQAVCKHTNPIQVRMRMGVTSVDFTLAMSIKLELVTVRLRSRSACQGLKRSVELQSAPHLQF